CQLDRFDASGLPRYGCGMRKKQTLLLIAALMTVACWRTPAAPSIDTSLSRDQFIGTMIDLELANGDGRPAVLKKHHTNEKELREFASKYAEQPALLSETLDTVQVRVLRARVVH